MKTMRIPFLVSTTLLVGTILLFGLYAGFWKSNSQDVKLWMSYDAVAKKLPHDREKLSQNPMAEDYSMNDEERKCFPFIGLDLEYEYGLVLGFNESFELVMINRITRARVHNPSRGVPVMHR